MRCSARCGARNMMPCAWRRKALLLGRAVAGGSSRLSSEPGAQLASLSLCTVHTMHGVSAWSPARSELLPGARRPVLPVLPRCLAVPRSRDRSSVGAASTTERARPPVVWGAPPPETGPWATTQRWVVFSDLHVSARSLDVCLEVLDTVRASV